MLSFIDSLSPVQNLTSDQNHTFFFFLCGLLIFHITTQLLSNQYEILKPIFHCCAFKIKTSIFLARIKCHIYMLFHYWHRFKIWSTVPSLHITLDCCQGETSSNTVRRWMLRRSGPRNRSGIFVFPQTQWLHPRGWKVITFESTKHSI